MYHYRKLYYTTFLNQDLYRIIKSISNLKNPTEFIHWLQMLSKKSHCNVWHHMCTLQLHWGIRVTLWEILYQSLDFPQLLDLVWDRCLPTGLLPFSPYRADLWRSASGCRLGKGSLLKGKADLYFDNVKFVRKEAGMVAVRTGSKAARKTLL